MDFISKLCCVAQVTPEDQETPNTAPTNAQLGVLTAIQGQLSREIEGEVNSIDVEDSGWARIAEIAPLGEFGLFVRVQSYGDNSVFDNLIQVGKRYRVVITRLED